MLVCPKPTPILPQVQEQAMEEYQALPPNSSLRILIIVGMNDRDKMRRCVGDE